MISAWSTPRYHPYPTPRMPAASIVRPQPLTSAGTKASTTPAIAITNVEVITKTLRLPIRSEMYPPITAVIMVPNE